jgi:hypothetical protein
VGAGKLIGLSMSDSDSSRRKRSIRGYAILLTGLVLVIGVGLFWRLSDDITKPSSLKSSAPPANSNPAIDTPAPAPGSTPSENPLMRDVPGHLLSRHGRIDYDRCDAKARSEMDTLIVRIDVGKVVVRESAWEVKSTSTRVGIASWLSECTQEDGHVTIFGDESTDPLATYNRATGYGSSIISEP